MKRKHIIIYTPTSKDGDPNMDGTIYNSNTNRMAISFFEFQILARDLMVEKS